MVEITSKGGNYLLNIGPKPDGTFPAESIERLRQIGEWMDVYGESIYATTASPFERLPWGRCTKKTHPNGTTLYLHVYEWPADGKLLVPGLKNEIKNGFLLGNGKKLQTSMDKSGLIVYVQSPPLDAIDTVVVLEVPGTLDIEKIIPTQTKNDVVNLPASEAHLFGGPQLETKDGTQNIGFWINADGYIEWPFMIRKEGTFDIKANIAVEAPDSTFEVIIDKLPIHVNVTSTGSYAAFTTVTLGQTQPLKAGEHTLQIKSAKNQWNPINLRRITLTPAE